MAICKSEAIILKIRNFRETSLIVNFFTKDFGKFSGLIKGIRNDPQRYGGLPLTFSRSFVVFYEGWKNNLNLVTQCDAQEQFLPIRRDLEKIKYAHYFVELLDAIAQNYDKNEQLFELMLNSLKVLSSDFPSWQMARIFEIRLLKLSGFKPHLDSCVNCQRKIATQGRFSSLLGGVICPSCFNLDRKAAKILQGTLASIDYIEKSSWQKAIQLRMSRNTTEELKTILNSFLDIHLDKKILSRKFLI